MGKSKQYIFLVFFFQALEKILKPWNSQLMIHWLFIVINYIGGSTSKAILKDKTRVWINFPELYHEKLCEKIHLSAIGKATMVRPEGKNNLELCML